MVTVYADRVGDRVGDKVGDYLSSNQQRILAILEENPKFSAMELSEKLGISKRKIETNISVLKQKGYLGRIGTTKTGYWKIIK